MCVQNLKFAALPVPEIIAIEVFGWGLRTSNLGKEEAVEGGDSTVRKSVGEFL